MQHSNVRSGLETIVFGNLLKTRTWPKANAGLKTTMCAFCDLLDSGPYKLQSFNGRVILNG